MGAEAWDYFVPYEEDVAAVLAKLRRREFEAGRFRGSELDPADMDEALENMDADGTASILDMMSVGDEPDFGVVAPLPRETLLSLFGTDRPTRAMVEACDELYEDIERGHGVYVVVYKDEKPSEIFFGGYSYD